MRINESAKRADPPPEARGWWALRGRHAGCKSPWQSNSRRLSVAAQNARAAGRDAAQLQRHAHKPYKEGSTPNAATSTSRKGLLMSARRHFSKALFPTMPLETVGLRISKQRMPWRYLCRMAPSPLAAYPQTAAVAGNEVPNNAVWQMQMQTILAAPRKQRWVLDQASTASSPRIKIANAPSSTSWKKADKASTFTSISRRGLIMSACRQFSKALFPTMPLGTVGL